MQLTNYLHRSFYPFKTFKKCLLMTLPSTLLLMTVACSDSSSDTDGSGYFKFYNASSNSPTVYVDIDDESTTQADFSGSSVLYPLDSAEYDLTFSWREGTNDYNEFLEHEMSVTDDDVELIVLAGDFNSPEIITYKYLDEDEDLSDEDDEENFTLRFINLFNQDPNIDIYISQEDQTFNEATLVGSFSYTEMSESQYFDIESYVMYVTEQGSDEVIYQSETIDFFYTTQYIMVFRENNGPSNSPLTLEKISKNSATIEYPDKDSRAEIRIYNGLIQHDLLSDFDDQIDFEIHGLEDSQSINNLSKGTFSEILDLPSGDYSMNMTVSGQEQAFATNHFVSLDTNQDKTVFVYITEEREEDDDDADSEEQISIFVNTLPVENSQRESLYDHQVNVINLIQDEEERFTLLDVNFVRSNETVASAEYDLTSLRATPKTILLPNNTYQVNVIATIDDSDLLLVYDELILDESSGDLFLILEEDNSAVSGYTAKFIRQN